MRPKLYLNIAMRRILNIAIKRRGLNIAMKRHGLNIAVKRRELNIAVMRRDRKANETLCRDARP
jgi:hypothetical protein